MKVIIRKTGNYIQVRTLPNGFPVGEIKEFKIGNTIEADKIVPDGGRNLILISGGDEFEDLITTQLPLESCGMIC